MKRMFDIFFAFTGLFLLLPVMTGIWLIIVFTDKRPGLFRQERVGLGGKPFMICKFRTMHQTSDVRKLSFDVGNTSRVTPFGRVLRTWKLDELPQLWNVLVGEMSVVGPRPEVSKWVNAFPDRWQKILSVRPGVTDPASIRFRNEETLLSGSDNPEQLYRNVILPEKLELYEKYVIHHSLLVDIGILWKTLCTVLHNGQCKQDKPGTDR